MEKNYTYEIVENGYKILIDGRVVIEQYEPFIPDKTKSYEENAKAQIGELKEMEKQNVQEQANMEDLQQEVTNLQIALAELVEGGI